MTGIIIAAIPICKQQKQTGIKAVLPSFIYRTSMARKISTPALPMLPQIKSLQEDPQTLAIIRCQRPESKSCHRGILSQKTQYGGIQTAQQATGLET